jgi:hypothetical protein
VEVKRQERAPASNVFGGAITPLPLRLHCVMTNSLSTQTTLPFAKKSMALSPHANNAFLKTVISNLKGKINVGTVNFKIFENDLSDNVPD